MKRYTLEKEIAIAQRFGNSSKLIRRLEKIIADSERENLPGDPIATSLGYKAGKANTYILVEKKYQKTIEQALGFARMNYREKAYRKNKYLSAGFSAYIGFTGFVLGGLFGGLGFLALGFGYLYKRLRAHLDLKSRYTSNNLIEFSDADIRKTENGQVNVAI